MFNKIAIFVTGIKKKHSGRKMTTPVRAEEATNSHYTAVSEMKGPTFDSSLECAVDKIELSLSCWYVLAILPNNSHKVLTLIKLPVSLYIRIVALLTVTVSCDFPTSHIRGLIPSPHQWHLRVTKT